MVGRTVTGYLVNASRAIDVSGPDGTPRVPPRDQCRHRGRLDAEHDDRTGVPRPTTCRGVASYVVRRRIGSGPWTVIASAVARSVTDGPDGVRHPDAVRDRRSRRRRQRRRPGRVARGDRHAVPGRHQPRALRGSLGEHDLEHGQPPEPAHGDAGGRVGRVPTVRRQGDRRSSAARVRPAARRASTSTASSPRPSTCAAPPRSSRVVLFSRSWSTPRHARGAAGRGRHDGPSARRRRRVRRHPLARPAATSRGRSSSNRAPAAAARGSSAPGR